MITLRNVEKFYEGGYGRSYVLRRINVEIKEGEFVTIMGPSGAGKSTLLSILGMLDGAWTGEFEFLEPQVHRMKPKDRVELNKKYIGFVFQSYHLIDNLTVYENLDIPLSYRNVKGSRARRRWFATRSTGSTSWASATCIRASFRADSSSWSRWRAR